MFVRLLVLLAWFAALPGLALAQTPGPAATGKTAAHAAAHPMAHAAVPMPMGPVLVDVNSADEKALGALPGVGPVRAKAIIANRPYSDKQQLVSKKAIPANVLAGLEDKVALVNVNAAAAVEMAKILPNVGPIRAQKIVDGRPYATLNELVTKGALTQPILSGLRGLVTTGS